MNEPSKKQKIIRDPLFKQPFAFGKYYLANTVFYLAAAIVVVWAFRPFENISYWWIVSLVPLFLSRMIFILIGWLLLSAVVLYYYQDRFEWYYLLGLPLCMYLGALTATLIHNAAHYNFKPRALNVWIGELCALQQLSAGYPVWRAMHFQHHAYPDDPVNDTHPPAGLSFTQFTNNSRVLVGRWFQYAYTQRWGDSAETRARWKKQEALMLAARFSKVLFIFVLLGPFYFAVFYLPSYIANVLFLASFNFYTHEQKEDGSIEIVNLKEGLYYRFCNTFLFGVFYHKNHHRKPNLFNPMHMVTALKSTQAEAIRK